MTAPVRVDDVMSDPVETVSATAPLPDAARSMVDAGVGSLLVESDDDPVGILTETDVVALVAEGADVEATTAGEAASRSLVTVERAAPVATAAERMADEDVKKLPVTDGDDLVGIVTTTDISAVFPSYHPESDDWVD